jgi:hypothetical protein
MLDEVWFVVVLSRGRVTTSGSNMIREGGKRSLEATRTEAA